LERELQRRFHSLSLNSAASRKDAKEEECEKAFQASPNEWNGRPRPELAA